MAHHVTDLLQDYDEDEACYVINKSNWSKQNVPKSKRLESKYLHRINLGEHHDGRGNKLKMSLSMKKNIDRSEHIAHESRKIRNKDKKDRATTEMVLDHRTKTVLYGMLSKSLIHSIYGSISTGKEANVYYATDAESKAFALKIYKTSILSFKDRARYVRGEHRFDKGYSKNPRKMVQLWAEKEFRNLHRIYSARIPAPKPLHVRQNVLLMTIIGEDGFAAPRLKDCKFIDEDEVYECYVQIMKYMRLMYWKCNLIHGDLSEYNILYFKGLPYIIDVSQSVEPQHPNSYEFLAKDCKNVNDYFRKNSIMTLSDLELFEYILDERHMNRTEKNRKIDDEAKGKLNDEIVFSKHDASWNDVIDLEVLHKIEDVCKERWDTMVGNEDMDEVRDCVNLKSNIMRSLFDVDDAFRIHQNKSKFNQISKFLLNESGDMEAMDKFNDSEEDFEDMKMDNDTEEDEDNDESGSEHQNVMFPEAPSDLLYHKNDLTKDELKKIRKANKRIVKAANRERRKHKLPKKVKKRKIKVARMKAGKSVWKG